MKRTREPLIVGIPLLKTTGWPDDVSDSQDAGDQSAPLRGPMDAPHHITTPTPRQLHTHKASNMDKSKGDVRAKWYYISGAGSHGSYLIQNGRWKCCLSVSGETYRDWCEMCLGDIKLIRVVPIWYLILARMRSRQTTGSIDQTISNKSIVVTLY